MQCSCSAAAVAASCRVGCSVLVMQHKQCSATSAAQPAGVQHAQLAHRQHAWLHSISLQGVVSASVGGVQSQLQPSSLVYRHAPFCSAARTAVDVWQIRPVTNRYQLMCLVSYASELSVVALSCLVTAVKTQVRVIWCSEPQVSLCDTGAAGDQF